MYLGKQAFACCEKLQCVDLRQCIYLEEIKDGTFDNSGVTTLKISSTINSMCDISNTKIETVYIDNDKYTIAEYNKLIENAGGIFWEPVGYDF